MPRGHSTGIARGGGTDMESTGRGHSIWNEMSLGYPFDHVSLMISTNQKPGFLALGQWEALILQKIMTTFQTKALLTNL